jgi:hypothetical protein
MILSSRVPPKTSRAGTPSGVVGRDDTEIVGGYSNSDVVEALRFEECRARLITRARLTDYLVSVRGRHWQMRKDVMNRTQWFQHGLLWLDRQ